MTASSEVEITLIFLWLQRELCQRSRLKPYLIDFEDSGKIYVPGENANLQRFHHFMCAPR